MTKKGISPLVATILLIAFVIILAILILFWYFNVIKEETEKTGIEVEQACATDLEFSVSNVYYEESQRTIFFTVQNDGIVAIGEFKVIVTDDSAGVSQSYTTPIGVAVAEQKQLSVGYDDQDITSIDEIELTPLITKQGVSKYCDEQKVTLKDVLPV